MMLPISYATYITSKNNETLKWLASLGEKKYREESQSFLLCGEKLVKEAAKSQVEITHLVVREDKENLLLWVRMYMLDHPKTQVLVLSPACFSKITEEKSPQGIAAVAKYLDFSKYYYIIYKENFENEDLGGVIFLDGIQDPGNLGAILRSAAAFGVSHVILSEDCVDIYHPRVLRSAMGAVFHLKVWRTGDLLSAVRALQGVGRRVFSAELRSHAIPVDQANLTSLDAIVIGNEGHGISREISLVSDGSIYLPISEDIESLNASVAASLLIWEQMKNKS